MTDAGKKLLVRRPGRRDYAPIWRAMQSFTNQRHPDTIDELWLLEHPPVYTLGQAAAVEHLLNPGDIPIVRVDRGGQVTYHGPGQLVAYLLLDLRRAGLGVKQLVRLLEQSIIALLNRYRIASATRSGAPGVYVDDKKIAALGLRIRRGCSFHGIALNVDMDLEPFSRINPCGHPGLAITQIRELVEPLDMRHIGRGLAEEIADLLQLTPDFVDVSAPFYAPPLPPAREA